MQFRNIIGCFAISSLVLLSLQACSSKKGGPIPPRTEDTSDDKDTNKTSRGKKTARVLKVSAAFSDTAKLTVQNSTSGKLRIFTILGDSAKSAFDSFLQPEEAATDPENGTNYQVKSGFGLECRKEKESKAAQCRFALDADGVVGRALPSYTWKDSIADLEAAKKAIKKITVNYDQIEITISGLDTTFDDFMTDKSTTAHLQSLSKTGFKIIFDLGTGAPIKNDTQVGATEQVVVTPVTPEEKPEDKPKTGGGPGIEPPVKPGPLDPGKDTPPPTEKPKTNPKKSTPKNPKKVPPKEIVRGQGQEKPIFRGAGKEAPKGRGQDKKKVEKKS